MLELGNGEMDASASVSTLARSVLCLVTSVGFPLPAGMPMLMHRGHRKRRKRGRWDGSGRHQPHDYALIFLGAVMGHGGAGTAARTRLHVRRKKELTARPYLLAKSGGRWRTRAAAAALGRRPFHAGEGEGEGGGLRCGSKGEGAGEGAQLLFSISFLFSIFLTSYYVNLKWFEFKFKCNF